MRVYEELFIVKPDTAEEEVDGFVDQLKTLITGAKGNIDKVDNWGVRKLAYRVSKYAEGHYILIQFSAAPDAVQEIERRLRVADMVIKFITVRIDEKQKKIEKRKKAREKRAARLSRCTLRLAIFFSFSSMRTVMNLITVSVTRMRRSTS